MKTEKDAHLPGVVHDLNNVFQTLLGVADLLADDAQSGHLSSVLMRSVRRGQDLAASLVAGQEESAPLAAIVDHAIAFIEDSVLALSKVNGQGPKIEFLCEIDAGLHLRRGRAWERVLVNLFMNSWRAMPGGGRILVRGRKSKSGIEILVQDQGVGIAPELLGTLFDARVSGYGSSGLGLHVVATIVQQDGGTVHASNRPGNRGAELRIALPAAASVKARTRAARA